MKKIALLATMVFLIATLATSAMAVLNGPIVKGTVWLPGYTDVAVGADVEIECEGVVKTDVTDSDGKYEQDFQGTACAYGSEVTVIATLGELKGKSVDVVDNIEMTDVGPTMLETISIELIPEFTTIGAGLILLGAAFVAYRKRK